MITTWYMRDEWTKIDSDPDYDVDGYPRGRKRDAFTMAMLDLGDAVSGLTPRSKLPPPLIVENDYSYEFGALAMGELVEMPPEILVDWTTITAEQTIANLPPRKPPVTATAYAIGDHREDMVTLLMKIDDLRFNFRISMRAWATSEDQFKQARMMAYRYAISDYKARKRGTP